MHSRDLQKGTEYLAVVSLATLTNEASSLTGSASFFDHVITVSILGGVSCILAIHSGCCSFSFLRR